MSHHYTLLTVQHDDDGADSLVLHRAANVRLMVVYLACSLLLLLFAIATLVAPRGSSSLLERWNASTPISLNYLHPLHNCTVAVRTEDACPMPEPDLELVTEMHVAMAACGRGENVRDLLVTHLKSWYLHQPVTVTYQFHVVTDNASDLAAYLSPILEDWPLHRLPNVSYYDINLLKDKKLRSMANLWAPCSGARIFLPLLLDSSIDAVAWLDTDALLVDDPRRLWGQFQLHAPSHWLSFTWTNDQPGSKGWYQSVNTSHPWPKPYGINAGVMLMNLSKARSWHADYFRTVVGVYERRRSQFRFGDQDLFNSLLAEQAELGEEIWLPMPAELNWRPKAQQADIQPSPAFTERSPYTIIHDNGASRGLALTAHDCVWHCQMHGLWLYYYHYWGWRNAPGLKWRDMTPKYGKV